jgi:predicted Fe-Mo cluster-binding NifX family protein
MSIDYRFLYHRFTTGVNENQTSDSCPLKSIMRTLAVTLFGSRLGPRFDFCEEILIVAAEESRIVSGKTVSISSLTPHPRIAELSNRNVKAMICGGINRVACRHLRSHGISVISNVMGEGDKAVNRYLAGELPPGLL